jgi:hypothetical protein
VANPTPSSDGARLQEREADSIALLNKKSNPADAEVDADCLGVPPEYAAAQCYCFTKKSNSWKRKRETVTYRV